MFYSFFSSGIMAPVFVLPQPEWLMQGESTTSSWFSPNLLSNKNQRVFQTMTGAEAVAIVESFP
jgi:hypothetical protein